MPDLTSPISNEQVQSSNKAWWQANPMSYDWHRTLAVAEGSSQFYDAVDARFFTSSSFYGGTRPFERWIPFEQIADKEVLEIGCGLGSHAQLLAEAGCRLTCIDITARAITNTRRRFELGGLTAKICEMDAERMSFADATFDFVWSWGVIHHSADPEEITRQVFRVLKPGGEFRVMVYHRRSLSALYALGRGVLSGKFWKGMSAQQVMSHYTDGYLARFYTPAEFRGVLEHAGFTEVRTAVLGQKSEILPLPGRGNAGRVKRSLLKAIPDRLADRILTKTGYFLFAVAKKGAPCNATP